LIYACPLPELGDEVDDHPNNRRCETHAKERAKERNKTHQSQSEELEQVSIAALGLNSVENVGGAGNSVIAIAHDFLSSS